MDYKIKEQFDTTKKGKQIGDPYYVIVMADDEVEAGERMAVANHFSSKDEAQEYLDKHLVQ